MKLRSIVVVLALLAVVACAEPEAPDAAGTWVGTITTEGNVTTVVNESGSVWGGTATLVEETSIGVDFGEEPYMLGEVSGVWASDDEIFVIDRQVPVVRVYDMDGRHLRDIGSAGQGPGEMQLPFSITGTDDGRIFVFDMLNQRVNVYGPGPDDVASWPVGRGRCCRHPIVMGRDGTLWIEGMIVNEGARLSEEAIRAHGPDGPIGEQFAIPKYDYERWTFTSNGREIEGVPNAPSIVWAMHPDGPLVAGANDRYVFEILAPDGRRTVVERFWDPVPVAKEEAEFWRRTMEESFGRMVERGGESPQWDGRMPQTKPAYRSFLAAQSGEIWVLSEAPAQIIPDCEPGDLTDLSQAMVSTRGVRPPGACFVISFLMDAFGADGRYLGPVEGALPHAVHTFLRGDMLITPAEDEAGTIMVKRYRLVLPGER